MLKYHLNYVNKLTLFIESENAYWNNLHESFLHYVVVTNTYGGKTLCHWHGIKQKIWLKLIALE